MDEQQVRGLVRDAIARHHGAAARDVAPSGHAPIASPMAPSPSAPHVSVAQFVVVRQAGETDCVIEPTVTCNHCGHCLCLGH